MLCQLHLKSFALWVGSVSRSKNLLFANWKMWKSLSRQAHEHIHDFCQTNTQAGMGFRIRFTQPCCDFYICSVQRCMLMGKSLWFSNQQQSNGWPSCPHTLLFCSRTYHPTKPKLLLAFSLSISHLVWISK